MQEKKKFIGFIIGLFGTTIIFWSVWVLRAYTWVEYQEVLVNVLGTLLIGLATLMLGLVYVIFRIARPSYELVQRKKMMVTAIICIFIVMVANFFMLHELRDYGYTISTIAAIEEKESEGGKYYFMIKDSGDDSIVTFECSKKTYDTLKMEEDTMYSVQYRQLSFGTKKATLGYIDVVNNTSEEEKTE